MRYATEEQLSIVESRAHRLKVQAFAGTGKTATATMFIQSRPRTRFLYLVFNKSAQIEARNRFRRLPNVRPQTTHSLAYRLIGHRFRHKLQGSLRSAHVQAAIDPRGQMNYRSRMLIAGVVNAFLRSRDEQINLAHVRAVTPADTGVRFDRIQQLAQQLWQAMSDPDNLQVAITHDGYLKLLQSARIDLSQWFDHIIVDEGQDINPLTAAILEQQSLPQLFIGDSHQAIYRFRGAVNALEQVRVDETRTLTSAFRYGPELAILASMTLANHKGEDDLIIGYGGATSIQLDDPLAGGCTRVHRTFAECFRSAFEALQRNQRVHWVGGIGSYPLSDLTNLYYLKSGQWGQISDWTLAREFPTYEAYRDSAKTLEDPEMLRLIRVVEEFDGQIPSLVARMQASAVDAEKAQCTVTTAHRAKGLQWSQVELADDFPDWHDNRRTQSEHEDEINLAYVAATRARDSLSLSSMQYEQLTTAPPPRINRTPMRS